MKLTLVASSPGKLQGQVIPITRSPFLIGRDPGCHLRPGSPSVGKRHCAVTVQGGRVWLRDFESSHGTFVNGRRVTGEVELRHEDRLTIGPLEFAVRVVTAGPVSPAAPSNKARAASADDDDAAAMLIFMEGGDSPASGNAEDRSEGAPGGSTAIELEALPPPGDTATDVTVPPLGPGKPPSAKPPAGDSSAAAQAILNKLFRGGR
jgi:predicted component of type VI protein secretion system